MYRAKTEVLKTPTASPVIHKDDKHPDTAKQLKALGNAILPQIVEEIGRAIMKVECK